MSRRTHGIDEKNVKDRFLMALGKRPFFLLGVD